MNAREYHETALRPAFGDKLPEVLPNLLKALPPDRAAALTAVIEVQRRIFLAQELISIDFSPRGMVLHSLRYCELARSAPALLIFTLLKRCHKLPPYILAASVQSAKLSSPVYSSGALVSR